MIGEQKAVESKGFWQVMRYRETEKTFIIMQLLAKGVEYYSPMYRRIRKVGGATTVVAWPVFKGYVFIRRNEVFLEAGGIQGCLDIFKRPVPDKIVEGFRATERDGLIDLIDPPSTTGDRALKVGDRVQTLDGFLELVVSELVDANRVRLLTAMLKGDESARPIETSVDNIRIIERADNDNEPAKPKRGRKKGKKSRRKW